jgi:hypothetical protein
LIKQGFAVADFSVDGKQSVIQFRLGILCPVIAPKFEQPARRNLLAPVLIAFLVLGIIITLVILLTPHSVADVSVTHLAVYPTHTVYKSDTMLIGRDQAQDDLYALATVSLTDRLNLPIFLKDFTGTLTTAEGEEIAGTASQKNDIENLYTTFPALRKLGSKPLLRDTLISPSSSAEGMILLHFPVSAETWNRRKSAKVSIDLYHQGPLTIDIPPGADVAVPANQKGTPNE